MKRSLTTILLLFTAILMAAFIFPTPALADGGEGGLSFSQTIGGYTITLVFEKPASIGENPVHVKIVDAAGMPVPGAEVEISVEEHSEAEESAEGEMDEMEAKPTEAESSPSTSMHGMEENPAATPTPGTMSSINSISPVSDEHDEMAALEPGHEEGEYEGELAIEKDGDLAVLVHITVQGELLEAEFPLEVAKSNAGSIVLSVFAAINAGILAVAFVMKSKIGKA